MKRKASGLTLEQLSERTNLSPNYLGRVENERVDPSLSVAVAVARALHTPVGELVGDVRDRQAAREEETKKTGHVTRADARELALLLASLPLDVQETLIPALRTVAKRIARRRRGPR